MPVKVSDDLSQPIGVVMIIKGLDAEGKVLDFIAKTDDVRTVEAVGMCLAASDEFRACLLDLPRIAE
jgi:hypothetical protein